MRGPRYRSAAQRGSVPRTRRVEAGSRARRCGGRIGRGANVPPQLGQRPPSTVSAHDAQNVHSYVQIIASGASGGRFLSQHSQFGRSSSMVLAAFPAGADAPVSVR